MFLLAALLGYLQGATDNVHAEGSGVRVKGEKGVERGRRKKCESKSGREGRGR